MLYFNYFFIKGKGFNKNLFLVDKVQLLFNNILKYNNTNDENDSFQIIENNEGDSDFIWNKYNTYINLKIMEKKRALKTNFSCKKIFVLIIIDNINLKNTKK